MTTPFNLPDHFLSSSNIIMLPATQIGPPQSQANPAPILLRNQELPGDYVHIYINVGDCGADQTAFRSYLRTELTKPAYDRISTFNCQCFKHQYHLIAQGSLVLVDRIFKVMSLPDKPIKYFSGLATMGHSWRSHLSKIRAAALGMKLTNKLIQFRVPPLAIAGRWGSIDSLLPELWLG